MHLRPESRSLIDLFGDSSNDRYYVPSFQRDYAWGAEQVPELWTDLMASEGDGEGTFLGHLILYRKSSADVGNDDEPAGLGIIDGQQRLTTLSLLILACRDHAREKKLMEHAADLQRLLSFTDRVSLNTGGVRVEVASNISSLYKYMVSDEAWFETSFPTKLKGVTKLKRGANRIRPVYDFFRNELRKLKKEADFIKLKGAVYNCYFIVLEINEKSQAFEIFERNNARGIPLNIADLLKNLLFSRDDLTTLEQKWDEIVKRAGSTMQRMIKYYAYLHHGLVRKKDTYRKLRGTVLGMQTPEFMTSLDKFSVFYSYCNQVGDADKFNTVLTAIGNANVRGNESYCKSIKRSIDALSFFGITQTTPVIYAGLNAVSRLEEKGRSAPLSKLIVEVVECIEKYHFVNNVICTSVGHDIEVLYANKAAEFYKCPSVQEFKAICKDLITKLKEKRETKGNFTSKFVEIYYGVTPYELGLIGYIFDRFQNVGEYGAQIEWIFNTDPEVILRDFSIDHFWEQGNREHFEGDPDMVDNIGNLNILPRHTNSDDVNSLEIPEKIKVLKQRNYEGLKYLKDFLQWYESDCEKWTETEVRKRATLLAEKAFDEIWAF